MDKVGLKTLPILTFAKGTNLASELCFLYDNPVANSFLRVESRTHEYQIKILDKGNFRGVALLESVQSCFNWCERVQIRGKKFHRPIYRKFPCTFLHYTR